METWFGAQGVPQPHVHAHVVAALAEHTQTVLRDGDLATGHNAYVTYLTMMLMGTTGHRPVIDPFCERAWIDTTAGHCLIADKAVTERHRYRLAWLVPLACDLLLAYDHHLEAVALRLARGDAPQVRIAHAIRALLAGENAQLPYLFYLAPTGSQSVTPGRLQQQLGNLWPFPLNIGRHLLASGLRERHVARLAIAAHLGHLEALDHPFGSAGTHSLTAVASQLQPKLTDLIVSQQWQLIRGFTADPHHRISLAAARDDEPPVHEHDAFGPERRRRERAAQRKLDFQAVRRLIDTVLFEDVDGRRQIASARERIALIQERILAETKGNNERARRRLALLWRFLGQLRRQGHSLDLPIRVMVLAPEPSPFTASFVEDSQAERRLHEAFLGWLADGARRAPLRAQHPPRALRIAEICIAAALYSHLSRAQQLETLAITLTTGTPHALAGVLYLDLPGTDDSCAPWRWFPDPLSTGLLRGLAAMDDPPLERQKPQLAQALSAVLRALGLSSRNPPWQTLAQVARAGAHARLPPYLAAVVRGDTPMQPLPVSALARLLSGQRLVPKQTQPEGISPADTATTAAIGAFNVSARARSRPSLQPGETEQIIASVHRILRDALNAEHLGAQARAPAVRKRLNQLLSAYAQGYPQLPVAAGMLVDWGCELAQRGTRFKRHLKPATITRYLGVLIRPLLESAGCQDLLIFNDQQQETLYARMLDYAATGKQRRYLAGRCAEFHAFCVRTWSVEAVDPAIFGGVGTETPADANLVTPDEYRRTRHLLCPDPGLAPRPYLQQAALLILGYRFGLRIGEALRLRAREVHYQAGLPVALEVRGNVAGDPKTPAGTRLVPLLGPLAPDEEEVLVRMRRLGEEALAEDLQAPYFHRSPGTREEFDHAQGVRRLHAALRQITGEQDMRFHHLRRSWSQRVFVSLVGPQPACDPWQAIYQRLCFDHAEPGQLRLQFTGRRQFDSSTLYALSQAIGHSSVPTTISNYLHLLDALIPLYAPDHYHPLNDQALSYIYGRTAAAIRKQRSRYHIPATAAGRLLTSDDSSRSWPRPAVVLQAHPREGAEQWAGVADPGAHWTLEDVDRLLCAVRRQPDIALLARERGLPEGCIKHLLHHAARLEAETGYTHFAVSDFIDSWTGVVRLPPAAVPQPASIEGEPETRRLRRFLRALTLDLHSPDSQRVLEKMTTAWARAYSTPKGSDRLRFTRNDDLTAFFDGWAHLSFSLSWLRATVFGALAISDPLRACGDLQRRNPEEPMNNAVKLALISGRSPLGYQQTLDRFLFLLAVALQTRC